MELSFSRATLPLRGTVEVPGDKSLAHRSALFAALAEGDSEIARFPDSGVTRAMRGALASLGVPSVLEDGTLKIRGNGWRPFPCAGAVAYCGNSATTFRLLAGAIAGTGSQATLDGSAGLRRRPMNRIVDPLRAMGAKIASATGCAADGREIACAPLEFSPSPLQGIEYAVPVASAQVLSCLQLAALGASGKSDFTVPGPVRDHTSRMLSAMGVELAGSQVSPLAGKALKPLKGVLAGDISSATFLLAAAAIVPKSEITIKGVGINPTRTGALDILAQMGARITFANKRESLGESVADITLVSTPLKAVTVAGDLVVRAIDEFPALAAAFAFADGVSVVRDARELRYKETDRIAAIVNDLKALGAEAEELEDGFSVRGGTLRGGRVNANGDHRLAMAMAICSLRAPVTVEGAEILNESFPAFEPTLNALLFSQPTQESRA